MQHDEVIWQIINHEFCSFKSKVAKERTFCQNPYNVTGLCIRSACPLANSRYATIREDEGACYLYVKTIERAHTPKKLWEKIKLPSNYIDALAIVSKHLEHFPKYLVHRNKQRLTKIHQMLIRMRKLKLKARPKLVSINTNNEKLEKGKERKALKAAQLDRAIERELLERLKQVSDGEIYNYPEANYTKILSKATQEYEKDEKSVKTRYKEDSDNMRETEIDDEVAYVEEEAELEDGDAEYTVEYVEDFEESDNEGEEVENTAAVLLERYQHIQDLKMKRKTSSSTEKRLKKKGRIEVEYEEENEMHATGASVEYNF